MNGRYVVGVNGSRTSQAAVEWARTRAAQDGRPCVPMHVQEDLAEVPRLEMDAWAGESLVVLYGPVAASLAGYARTGDVLVVGTDKSGFIHGRVLGSLPVQVAALAVCMVAVIPAVDLRFRAGVVAGIDRHDSAVAVAQIAAAEAMRGERPLQLVQARPDGLGEEGFDPAVAAAETTVRDGWPTVTLRTRVVARPAAPALLDAARNAELLVLGPGRPPHRMPRGSRWAGCSMTCSSTRTLPC